ncbi:MAG: DUF4369 domain-containing protein [Prevotella sp.]|nr:DUF4369 domain-containing protein [Prevotella sp.]
MKTRNWLLITIIGCLLAACGGSGNRFRLEGQFKNLNQGEFYLYNLEQGTKDTIKVNDGRFVYDVYLNDTVTYALLFPNYSELPIFAMPGATVKMEGDVSHLKETKILGTPDNKEMTDFRLRVNNMTPPEVKKHAQQFIEENPASPLSIYMLQRFFIQDVNPDYALCAQLATAISKAQPEHIAMQHLSRQLNALRNAGAKGKLPQFTAVDTNGRTVSRQQLQSTVNVVIAWAAWSYESQNILHQMQRLQNEYGSDLAIMSVSLDASVEEGRYALDRDSIRWPNICDGKLWESPLVTTLGMTSVPGNIIADKQGNIIARDLSASELEEKIKAMIK